eukprot:920785-Rhodomonas_salina.1
MAECREIERDRATPKRSSAVDDRQYTGGILIRDREATNDFAAERRADVWLGGCMGDCGKKSSRDRAIESEENKERRVLQSVLNQVGLENVFAESALDKFLQEGELQPARQIAREGKGGREGRGQGRRDRWKGGWGKGGREGLGFREGGRHSDTPFPYPCPSFPPSNCGHNNIRNRTTQLIPKDTEVLEDRSSNLKDPLPQPRCLFHRQTSEPKVSLEIPLSSSILT